MREIHLQAIRRVRGSGIRVQGSAFGLEFGFMRETCQASMAWRYFSPPGFPIREENSEFPVEFPVRRLTDRCTDSLDSDRPSEQRLSSEYGTYKTVKAIILP